MEQENAKDKYTRHPTPANYQALQDADAQKAKAILSSIINLAQATSSTNPVGIAKRVGTHAGAGLGLGVLTGALVKRRRDREEAEDAQPEAGRGK